MLQEWIGAVFNVNILGIVVQLIFLECILSIDNAAVMGAMVAHLPDDQSTPWPARWKPALHWADRLLGNQRTAALKVGLIGAYAGRVLMLILASIIIRHGWVQILGAIYLLHLAIQHFVHQYRHSRAADDEEHRFVQKRGFWGVVVALNLADLAFSIDNVVAAVALSDRLWAVIVGVGIGILIIRFAATIFTRMITWEPKLESGAYLLLLAIGIELLLDKLFGIHTDDLSKFVLSICILLLTVTFARVQNIQPLLLVFRPVLAVLAWIEDTAGALAASLTRRSRGAAYSDEANGPSGHPDRQA